jgi:hypothetical protein
MLAHVLGFLVPCSHTFFSAGPSFLNFNEDSESQDDELSNTVQNKWQTSVICISTFDCNNSKRLPSEKGAFYSNKEMKLVLCFCRTVVHSNTMLLNHIRNNIYGFTQVKVILTNSHKKVVTLFLN